MRKKNWENIKKIQKTLWTAISAKNAVIFNIRNKIPSWRINQDFHSLSNTKREQQEDACSLHKARWHSKLAASKQDEESLLLLDDHKLKSNCRSKENLPPDWNTCTQSINYEFELWLQTLTQWQSQKCVNQMKYRMRYTEM